MTRRSRGVVLMALVAVGACLPTLYVIGDGGRDAALPDGSDAARPDVIGTDAVVDGGCGNGVCEPDEIGCACPRDCVLRSALLTPAPGWFAGVAQSAPPRCTRDADGQIHLSGTVVWSSDASAPAIDQSIATLPALCGPPRYAQQFTAAIGTPPRTAVMAVGTGAGGVRVTRDGRVALYAPPTQSVALGSPQFVSLDGIVFLADDSPLEITPVDRLLNGFMPVTTADVPPPALYVDHGGTVHLVGGVVHEGDAGVLARPTAIFTLPPESSPADRYVFQTMASTPAGGSRVGARVDVVRTGSVDWMSDMVGDAARLTLSLDGIAFESSASTGSWTNVTLTGDWTAVEMDDVPPSARTDCLGVVHARGRLQSGSFRAYDGGVTDEALGSIDAVSMSIGLFPAQTGEMEVGGAIGLGLDGSLVWRGGYPGVGSVSLSNVSYVP